ncbi:MAG: MBL fold metallo-hydrolase [Pseudomonadota bacterium]
MLTLGELTVTPLPDLPEFDLPLAQAFPEADLTALPDWLGPRDISDTHMHLTVRSWLLRHEGRCILVDSCVGAGKPRANWPEWHQRDGAEFRGALDAAGVGPEDIDLVVFTHLHPDHVGWNTVWDGEAWVPTFPNARYIAGRHEFEVFEKLARKDPEIAYGAIADSVLPVAKAGQFDLVEDGFEVAPGLTLLPAPGHSPGHMMLRADHGPGAVFCGDVLHGPLQFAQPTLSSAFCADPDQARATRLALLEELADTETLLIPGHILDPGYCAVAREGSAFRPVWPA